MPMAIPIVIGAGSGFLSSTVPAVVAGTAINWTAVGAMTAIGAGMGALGLLLQPDRGDSNNNTTQRLSTTNSRNIPVPVLYGKAKMSGNWLALGNFFVYKDAKDGTPGVRLREIHAFLGLCEGPVQKVENFKIDDKTIKEQLEETELEDYHFRLVPVLGTRGQRLPGYLASASERKKYGFDKMADPVPWRNTAYVICGVNVGQEPRFPEVVCEVTGPDLSIWRKGQTGDTVQNDIVRSCHYDGYSESFYATLSSSDRTGPFGLLRTPRWRGIAQHTQPPASVAKNIQRAWYLGKHDALVMQDPDDPATFHIGYWLISPASGDWEKVRPDPGYGSPILKDHLDELNGHLHTLHKGSSGFYVMRWNLLTGWITRLDLDVSSPATVTLFLFAPDFDAYIIGTKDRRLIFLDANTGKTYHSTTKLHTDSAKGLCISGNLVGLLYDAGVVYYDPFKKTTLRRYGSNGGGYAAAGNLGGSLCLTQNTWTGHLTIIKTAAGSAVYINTIPSIPEPKMEKAKKKVAKIEKESRYINGRLTTVSKTVYEEKEVWEDHTDYVGGWARDWSYRLPASYSYHGLEGISSLAAAMWSTLVDEPATRSARWGAGLSSRYFSLSSFECLHAYAVGAVLYPYKKTTRYMERYRFDYLLDGERTVADLMANEMLLAVNGFRTLIDGKLYVSPQRTALASAWHFTPHQTVADSGKVTFTGRASSANRVRVEFADASDDYRRDFGEANDEYDENARGRVVTTNLSANGVTRLGHARNLAQQLCDALASNRRQVTFKTHWIGFVLSPGDGIEVSDEKLGLSRFLGRVTSISENENNEIEITAVEHQPVRDYLASSQWGGDEDETASCAALATSAEYRHGICMSPMHAAVFEDENEPRLVPVAGLSPKSKFAEQLRVDYKFDDDAKWTSLGKMDSSFGGFVVGNVSAKTRTVVIDGLHGTSERKILGDLPMMLARHEALGPQSPRPIGGDEAALATTYVTANHAFGARRPEGQAWTAETPAIAYAYRLHAVADEDSCFQPSLYVQGFAACSEVAQDAYIPLDQVPSFPFYFRDNTTGKNYVVKSGDAATDEPGPILTDWQAIVPEDVCPSTCGFTCEIENGANTILSDIKVRAIGRFDATKSWASGAVVLGDQTVMVEMSDSYDSYYYNRNTLIYPRVNGKDTFFEKTDNANGTTVLQSIDADPKKIGNVPRGYITLKHGDRLELHYECWTTQGGTTMYDRIAGPTVIPFEPIGVQNTAGMPAGGWTRTTRSNYPYKLMVTVAGTNWPGAKNVIDEQFATDGPLDPGTWDIRCLDMYEGTFSQAYSGGASGGASQLYKSGGVLKIDTGKHIWMHYCGPKLNLGSNYAIEAALQNPVGGDNNGNENLSFFLNEEDNFPPDLPPSQRQYSINMGIHVQLGKGSWPDGQGGYTPLQHYVQIIGWGAVNNSTVLAEWRAGSLLSYPITLRVECINGKDYTVKINGTNRLTYSAPFSDLGFRGFAIGRWDTTALGGSPTCTWLDNLKVWVASTPDAHNGTWKMTGSSVSGDEWWWDDSSTRGSSLNWQIVMHGTGGTKDKPAYWKLTNANQPGCSYKLVGSEGLCSPVGIFTLESLSSSNCGGDWSPGVVTITLA